MHSDMTSPIHDMGSRVGCQEAVCCICCIAGCRGPDLQEKSSLYRDWVAMQAGLVFHPPVGEPAARLALEDFNRHWNGKYQAIVDMWEKDWDEIMACMDLSETLRKITYTTNAIENLNREIRRATKTKGAWVSDRALLIQLFLSLERSRKSWNKDVHNWANVTRELIEKFGDRFANHIIQ